MELIVNKQVISTLIILLFLIPFIIFVKTTLIDSTTHINEIQGIVSKVECKKINRKLNGEVYIYYNNSFLKFQDSLLKGNTFSSRCRELSNILMIGKKFYAKTLATPSKVLDLEINNYKILNFDDTVKEFNHLGNMTILITVIIGILLILGNIFIYYKKINPEKILEYPWFQKVLYFVAIMGILRFLLK
jgi:hypothetical protein